MALDLLGGERAGRDRLTPRLRGGHSLTVPSRRIGAHKSILESDSQHREEKAARGQYCAFGPTKDGSYHVIAGLVRVALSFRSRRKTGRLRLCIATAESGPTLPTCAVHQSRQLSEVLRPASRTAAIAVFDPNQPRCNAMTECGSRAIQLEQGAPPQANPPDLGSRGWISATGQAALENQTGPSTR